MTNDLEQMLRSSLQRRAEDVEPTPQLWREVQRKVQRRRVVPLLAWSAAAAAAAVTAFAVVPAVVDGTRDRLEIQPLESPTAPDGTPARPGAEQGANAPLSHYVAAVDGRLVLRDLDGGETVLWAGESQVRTLAVRPDSSPTDLQVAIATTAEGMLDIRVVSWRNGEVATSDVFGLPMAEEGTVPTIAWNPAGDAVGFVIVSPTGPELVLTSPTHGATSTRTSLPVPGLQLQAWTTADEGEVLWLTRPGTLRQARVERTDSEWQVGELYGTDAETPVVDLAIGEDGTQYRLLLGGGSQDAEGDGLTLEFDNEVVRFPELSTASPGDAWLTAVQGGAFLGLGSEARLVVRDREGDSAVVTVGGVSYGAWVPGGPEPVAGTSPLGETPTSDLAGTPYLVVDEAGEVVLVTATGREVVFASEHRSPDEQVAAIDVSVRPGSTADDVIAVALLETPAGPEFVWFHATNGATAVLRMEGATGLGATVDDPDDAPVWSPDGRHVAWVEPADGGGWTLRTVGVDAAGRPTSADAGFGLDVDAGALRLADWSWDDVPADGSSATGSLLLVDDAGTAHRLPVERQGDGALGISGGVETVPVDGDVTDVGVRRGGVVSLVRSGAGYAVQQASGDVQLQFLAADEPDLDLDVLADLAIVTDRSTGIVVLVHRDGAQRNVDHEQPASYYALDPVR